VGILFIEVTGMANRTPETMVEDLKRVLGGRLVSVVLFGSAAAGDHAGKRSDYNLMVVTDRLDLEDLVRVAPIVPPWVKAGNPPPLFMTKERVADSADVFPVEFSDIQDNHRVLFGDDPFGSMAFDEDQLRWELEHELKGKLIQLRERFLALGGDARKVEDLMVASLSTFLVLFKNALRLYGEKPPLAKMDALARLRERLEFDREVFQLVQGLKEGVTKGVPDRMELFGRYLKAVETIVDAVDRHARGNNK
jgi:hypothetical protein